MSTIENYELGNMFSESQNEELPPLSKKPISEPIFEVGDDSDIPTVTFLKLAIWIAERGECEAVESGDFDRPYKLMVDVIAQPEEKLRKVIYVFQYQCREARRDLENALEVACDQHSYLIVKSNNSTELERSFKFKVTADVKEFWCRKLEQYRRIAKGSCDRCAEGGTCETD